MPVRGDLRPTKNDVISKIFDANKLGVKRLKLKDGSVREIERAMPQAR